MKRNIFLLICLILAFAFNLSAQEATQGELNAISKDGKSLGECPLKHTRVEAEISGFLSRVKVTQEFENNLSEKIEAVYVFPLPSGAAVDDMVMRIGERVVRGKIMKREEAKEVYEAARNNGQIASLLDQERPNIFTQSVANILPGEKILIEISYVETLAYEDGSYEFVFPMVVGPRYNPGKAVGRQASGISPDTNKVPDASKITPPIAAGRAGHDISIEVKLDAGVPLESVSSKSHKIDSAALSASSYSVRLKNQKVIPNKDFILKYDVAGKKIEDAILSHRGKNGGFFTLILQPPDAPAEKDITPKEIVFVLDTSGSMSGFPIEKAKESMKMALDGLHANDTFNLITFAGDTSILFEKPVAATPENLRKAQAFLESRRGGGGTEMMKAIKAALDPSDSQEHLRIVCFMTDGYVENDMQIVAEIQKHPNARVFSFGIGSSVNRYLLEKMADEGKGEVEFVSLQDDGTAAAKRFHERVRSPLLTDISLDFGGMEVADVYPKRINDLFSAKPVVIHGRYLKGGSGSIKLKGKSYGRESVREIPVNFAENEPANGVLATLWARTRIGDLMAQDYAGIEQGNAQADIKETITNLALEFRLMSQFTSFVAVEEAIVTDGGKPRTIDVPVELPDGMYPEPVIIEAAKDETAKIAGTKQEGAFQIDGASSTEVNVVVSASTPGINTQRIQNLPINGRRASNLMLLSPGLVASGDAHGFIGQMTVGRRNRKSSDSDGLSDGTGFGGGKGSGKGRGSGNAQDKKVTPDLNKGYRDWVKKDVDYIISGERLQKESIMIKASNMPKPIFPTNGEVSSEVKVEVMLDPKGAVTSAKAISGEKTYFEYAEKAATGAAFILPKINYEVIKVSGVISFNFDAKGKSAIGSNTLEKALIELKPKKFNPAIKALIERQKNNQPASADEAKFVKDSKAEVMIRMKELNPENIAELKKQGFEVMAETHSLGAIIGRIRIDSLEKLAEIDSVIFIGPQMK